MDSRLADHAKKPMSPFETKAAKQRQIFQSTQFPKYLTHCFAKRRRYGSQNSSFMFRIGI